MNAAAIIIDAATAGVELIAEGDALRFRGPRSALNDELLQTLCDNRDEVIAALKGSPPARCPTDIAERAATIAEGDGFSDAEAEQRALESVLRSNSCEPFLVVWNCSGGPWQMISRQTS